MTTGNGLRGQSGTVAELMQLTTPDMNSSLIRKVDNETYTYIITATQYSDIVNKDNGFNQLVEDIMYN